MADPRRAEERESEQGEERDIELDCPRCGRTGCMHPKRGRQFPPNCNEDRERSE